MSDDAEQLVAVHLEGLIEDTSLVDVVQLEQWLVALANSYDAEIRGLTFVLADDDYVLKINQDHLNHDYYTDVITFPYREGAVLEADIFISVDRVADNATQHGEPFTRELHRVIAHGVLHLLGFRDKAVDEEKAMRLAEEKALMLLDDLTH